MRAPIAAHLGYISATSRLHLGYISDHVRHLLDASVVARHVLHPELRRLGLAVPAQVSLDVALVPGEEVLDGHLRVAEADVA